jgi:hypothetical protein
MPEKEILWIREKQRNLNVDFGGTFRMAASGTMPTVFSIESRGL